MASAPPSERDRDATAMLVGLVDTRKPEPEPEDEREPLLDRIPELRPLALVPAPRSSASVASGYTPAWASVDAASPRGLCCFFQALTSYYGQRRAEQYRQ